MSIERTLLRDFANAATITAIFVAFQLTASLAAGTLSLPPTYADVGYYVDAASRVQTFWQGNALDVLRGYIANPPHAPGSTLLTTRLWNVQRDRVFSATWSVVLTLL